MSTNYAHAFFGNKISSFSFFLKRDKKGEKIHHEMYLYTIHILVGIKSGHMERHFLYNIPVRADVLLHNSLHVPHSTMSLGLVDAKAANDCCEYVRR